jgi:hypothetical protein
MAAKPGPDAAAGQGWGGYFTNWGTPSVMIVKQIQKSLQEAARLSLESEATKRFLGKEISEKTKEELDVKGGTISQALAIVTPGAVAGLNESTQNYALMQFALLNGKKTPDEVCDFLRKYVQDGTEVSAEMRLDMIKKLMGEYAKKGNVENDAALKKLMTILAEKYQVQADAQLTS